MSDTLQAQSSSIFEISVHASHGYLAMAKIAPRPIVAVAVTKKPLNHVVLCGE